jgi:hypothetical protein
MRAKLRLLVLLVTRLLASSTDQVTQEAYAFLREARSVTLNWLKELQIKLQKAEVDADIIAYQFRVCEMASICRSTYDVDPRHIPSLLSESDDFTTFVRCSIALYDNQPGDLLSAPRRFQVLLFRDRRLSHKIAPTILQVLKFNKYLLCTPISEIWPHYKPGPAG